MRAKLRLPDKFKGMNKVETEWALQLEANMRSAASQLAQAGEATLVATQRAVVRWRYEEVRFKLADRTWLLPDFWVLFADGHVEIHEVKQMHPPTRKQKAKGATVGRSGWKEDARVKFKAAAAIYSELQWVACERQLDGSWTTTRAEDLFKRKGVAAQRIGRGG